MLSLLEELARKQEDVSLGLPPSRVQAEGGLSAPPRLATESGRGVGGGGERGSGAQSHLGIQVRIICPRLGLGLISPGVRPNQHGAWPCCWNNAQGRDDRRGLWALNPGSAVGLLCELRLVA